MKTSRTFDDFMIHLTTLGTRLLYLGLHSMERIRPSQDAVIVLFEIGGRGGSMMWNGVVLDVWRILAFLDIKKRQGCSSNSNKLWEIGNPFPGIFSLVPSRAAGPLWFPLYTGFRDFSPNFG